MTSTLSPLGTRARAHLKAFSLAALIGIILTACSTAGGDAATPVPTLEATPAPTAEAEPEPEPTPEVIEAAAGDLVTEEEAELLPEGQVAYPLDSGELVVVDANEPLPEVLVEEMLATVPAGILQNTNYVSRTQEAYDRAGRIARQTGRHVIFVGEFGNYETDGSLTHTHWTIVATGEAQGIARADIDAYWERAGSREQAIAFAEEVHGQVEDPDSYQIVIIDK